MQMLQSAGHVVQFSGAWQMLSPHVVVSPDICINIIYHNFLI